MTTGRLQAQLDQMLATTKQRWFLGGLAVLSVVLASASMALGSDHTDGWVVVLVGVLAVVAAVLPDDHLALVVMAVVVMHWLSLDPDVASPWSMAIAGCLYLFHTVIALMAVTPHSAVVDPAILRRWLARSVVVVASTGAVWALVAAFERRDAPGDVALTVVSLAVLTAAIVALRLRSVPPGTGHVR